MVEMADSSGLRVPVFLVAALLWFYQRPHTGLTSFLNNVPKVSEASRKCPRNDGFSDDGLVQIRVCPVYSCWGVRGSSWLSDELLASGYWLLSKGMWWTLCTCVFRFPF